MTSKRGLTRHAKMAGLVAMFALLLACPFAACLTPEVVDYVENNVVMVSPACTKCMATPDTPGPGCGDEVAVCRSVPTCSKSYDCALQRTCIGGPVQRLVACLPDCTRLAQLGSNDDPGRLAGLKVFECITHGACASVCFTDSTDGGGFPVDAGMPPVDAGGDGGGACTNAADLAAAGDRTRTNDAARTCGVECYGMSDTTCAAKCMKREVGFSEACATCWGGSINCVSEHCLGPCLGGPDDPGCISCSAQMCTPAFHACAGT
jgi:hypothetical protein